MKINLKLSLILAAVFAIGLFAYASTGSTSESFVEPLKAQVEASDSEEDIMCKVRDEDGDVVASCFMCNCEKLLETYWEQYRKNEKQKKDLA